MSTTPDLFVSDGIQISHMGKRVFVHELLGLTDRLKTDLKEERYNIRPWQTSKDPLQPNTFYDSITHQHLLEQKMLLQTSQWFSCSERSVFLLHHLVLQGWTLVTKVFLQTNDCILMLGAEMLPVFFQILQQFIKPQHLILCELNSVRTAGENDCECSWMSSLFSTNFWLVICPRQYFSHIKSAKEYHTAKTPHTNKTLNKQTKNQTLPTPPSPKCKQTNQKSHHTKSQNKPQR